MNNLGGESCRWVVGVCRVWFGIAMIKRESLFKSLI